MKRARLDLRYMERRYQLYMVWKKITYPLYRSVNFLWVSIRTKNSGACHNLLAFLQRRDASGVPIMKQVIGRFIHHKEPIPRSADPLFLELGFASPMTLHRAHKKTQEKRLFFFWLPKVWHCLKCIKYTVIWLVVSTPLKNASQNGSSPQVGMNIKNM